MSRSPAKEISRSGAREMLMQLLFQMEAQNDYGSACSEFFDKKLNCKKQEAYIEKMRALIAESLDAADTLIESCSDNWKIGRMCKVDLAVMRVAVLEITHMEDIPESVSINEAVDMAKKYGTEESGKFVNGILGKVVKNKNADERLCSGN